MQGARTQAHEAEAAETLVGLGLPLAPTRDHQPRAKRALPKSRDDDGGDVGGDLTNEGKKRLASADNRVRPGKELTDLFADAVPSFRVASAADAAHAEDCFALWASLHGKTNGIPTKRLRYDYDATYAGDTELLEALRRITTTAEMVAYLKERYKRATGSGGKRAKMSGSAAAAGNPAAARQDGSRGATLATGGPQAAADPIALQNAAIAAELQKAAAVASTTSVPYQQLLQLTWEPLAVPSAQSQDAAAAPTLLQQQQQLSALQAEFVAVQQATDALQQAVAAAPAALPTASAAAPPPSQGGAVPTFPLPLLPLPPPTALVQLQPLASRSGAVEITSDLPGLNKDADAAAAVQIATQGRSLSTNAVALLLDKADELGLPRSDKVPPNPKPGMLFLVTLNLSPSPTKNSPSMPKGDGFVGKNSHQNLRPKGQSATIKAIYHSLPDGSLQRRCYHHSVAPRQVLVHYLVPKAPPPKKRATADGPTLQPQAAQQQQRAEPEETAEEDMPMAPSFEFAMPQAGSPLPPFQPASASQGVEPPPRPLASSQPQHRAAASLESPATMLGLSVRALIAVGVRFRLQGDAAAGSTIVRETVVQGVNRVCSNAANRPGAAAKERELDDEGLRAQITAHFDGTSWDKLSPTEHGAVWAELVEDRSELTKVSRLVDEVMLEIAAETEGKGAKSPEKEAAAIVVKAAPPPPPLQRGLYRAGDAASFRRPRYIPQFTTWALVTIGVRFRLGPSSQIPFERVIEEVNRVSENKDISCHSAFEEHVLVKDVLEEQLEAHLGTTWLGLNRAEHEQDWQDLVKIKLEESKVNNLIDRVMAGMGIYTPPVSTERVVSRSRKQNGHDGAAAAAVPQQKQGAVEESGLAGSGKATALPSSPTAASLPPAAAAFDGAEKRAAAHAVAAAVELLQAASTDKKPEMARALMQLYLCDGITKAMRSFVTYLLKDVTHDMMVFHFEMIRNWMVKGDVEEVNAWVLGFCDK